MKIFTFGDGYATGHIWPEWPQILQALLPNYEVVNTAGIGAGPEFLVSSLVDILPQLNNQTVIFQWPDVNRFDKLVEDNSWDQIIQSDPVYYFNIVMDRHNQKWWLSSASKQLTQYHKHYVQPKQQQNRLKMYKILVSGTLDSVHCKYLFTSTQEQEKYSLQARFGTTRQNELQPSPWIHYCWLIEEILPKLNITPNLARQQRLLELIQQQIWTPYDSNRVQKWQTIEYTLNG